MVLRKTAGLLICTLLLALSGCGGDSGEIEKIKDIEFTVIAEADLPEALAEQIKEKKASPFTLTYADGEYMYIARGFGEQKSSGYSIEIKELFLGENAIYFKTELIGPSQQDLVAQICTYPYIVVKIEYMDNSVVFD